MRVSKIEARRVFTRYGWQPINSAAFANSAGKQMMTLESKDYRVQVYESKRDSGPGVKTYAKVTDRIHNERYHLSAYWDKLRFEEMEQELKLITRL